MTARAPHPDAQLLEETAGKKNNYCTYLVFFSPYYASNFVFRTYLLKIEVAPGFRNLAVAAKHLTV